MTCLCDPDIRCSECHGCECRPRRCGWTCIPELAWTPRMDVAAAPVAHWRRPPVGRLTFRHWMPAVAELAAEGMSSENIARTLGISSTVAYRARRALREAAA